MSHSTLHFPRIHRGCWAKVLILRLISSFLILMKPWPSAMGWLVWVCMGMYGSVSGLGTGRWPERWLFPWHFYNANLIQIICRCLLYGLWKGVVFSRDRVSRCFGFWCLQWGKKKDFIVTGIRLCTPRLFFKWILLEDWSNLSLKISCGRMASDLFCHNCAGICFIGVAFCAVFEFQKSSHLQPLAATRVAASGRKWPLCRVAASDRKWPQVAAFDAWPRCFNLIKSSHLQPLAATRVAASGRFSRVAASGREWPLFPSGRKWPRVAAFTT